MPGQAGPPNYSPRAPSACGVRVDVLCQERRMRNCKWFMVCLSATVRHAN